MVDAVTFGEVMAMFVATDDQPLHEVNRFDSKLAGAEMNVSVGLARLGCRVSAVPRMPRRRDRQHQRRRHGRLADERRCARPMQKDMSLVAAAETMSASIRKIL